jgi:hypothetical protein
MVKPLAILKPVTVGNEPFVAIDITGGKEYATSKK